MQPNDDIHGYRLERTVFTHSLLLKIAEQAASDAKGEESTDESTIALVFSAFALEAYLNYVGSILVPYSDEIDRVPVPNKLRLLCVSLGLKPNYGHRPYQTLKRLWEVRNYLAHARPEYMSEMREGPPPEPIVYPKTLLESVGGANAARRATEDVRAIIQELHAKAKLEDGSPGRIGIQGGEILRKRPGE